MVSSLRRGFSGSQGPEVTNAGRYTIEMISNGFNASAVDWEQF